MGCNLAYWLWQYQNSPHTADKSGSSPDENFHNIGWETGPLVVILKALLGFER